MSGPREQTTEPARDKIAAVIDEHTATGCEGIGSLNCWCGERFDTWAEHSLHVADAVIEQLGLTEEWGVQRAISKSATPRESESWCRERAEFLNDRYGPGEASVVRRWVSGWSVVGGDPK